MGPFPPVLFKRRSSGDVQLVIEARPDQGNLLFTSKALAVSFFFFFFLRDDCQMTEETKALKQVIRRADCSVPFGVRLWIIFKRWVLEDEQQRKHFEKLSMEEKRFREEMAKILKQRGPTEVKGPTPTASRMRRESVGVLWGYAKVLLSAASLLKVEGQFGQARGLGLFMRREAKLKDLDDWLFGLLGEVDQKDLNTLIENGYPSLYEGSKIGGTILFGPMSLLNHSCETAICFSSPKPRDLYEFETISLKDPTDPSKKRKLKKGKEILVNYRMANKDFDCECGSCRKRKKKS